MKITSQNFLFNQLCIQGDTCSLYSRFLQTQKHVVSIIYHRRSIRPYVLWVCRVGTDFGHTWVLFQHVQILQRFIREKLKKKKEKTTKIYIESCTLLHSKITVVFSQYIINDFFFRYIDRQDDGLHHISDLTGQYLRGIRYDLRRQSYNTAKSQFLGA